MRLIAAFATIVILTACPSVASGESVYVKYRGEVDLKSFDCTDINRSSFIERVCYDRRNEYMLISLNGVYYHYCEIGPDTVASLLSAPSMGRFYNANIKSRFDCRVLYVPRYSTSQPPPDDCRIVVWFRSACGALAVGSRNGHGWAWANSRGEAENNAINHCRGQTTNCGIAGWACTAQQKFGAIAFSSRDGAMGHSYNFSTRSAAEERALAECIAR
jgi:uncharacterized protein DUF4189/KTSC domain-containing protein